MNEADPVATWRAVQQKFQEYVVDTPAIKYTDADLVAHVKAAKKRIKVSVVRKDVLEVAIQEEKDGSRPLVLILADDERPGGCVGAGAGMQEESLFRRSALHKHLLLHTHYPIAPDELVYVPDVPLYHDNNNQKTMDFVACPGIKMPHLGKNRNMLNEADAESLRRKIRMILNVAILHGHRRVVLGALGCGVWGCPPKHVAQIFSSVIFDEHFDRTHLDHIIFAVTGNVSNVFDDVFSFLYGNGNKAD